MNETMGNGTEMITIWKVIAAKLLTVKCLSERLKFHATAYNFTNKSALKETIFLNLNSHSLEHVCSLLRGANETGGKKE